MIEFFSASHCCLDLDSIVSPVRLNFATWGNTYEWPSKFLKDSSIPTIQRGVLIEFESEPILDCGNQPATKTSTHSIKNLRDFHSRKIS